MEFRLGSGLWRLLKIISTAFVVAVMSWARNFFFFFVSKRLGELAFFVCLAKKMSIRLVKNQAFRPMSLF